MTELRWILLGLGALFCLGLWYWEARRSRRAQDEQESRSFDGPSAADAVTQVAQNDTVRHRIGPAFGRVEPTFSGLDDDDLPIDAKQSPHFGAHFDSKFDPEIDSEFDPELENSRKPLPEQRPAVRSSPPPAPAPAPARAATKDKILAVRVLAYADDGFPGAALSDALYDCGLKHGKFSIFHRYSTDGSTMFSVASLLEPGHFDLEQLDRQLVPGVTLFTMLKPSAEPEGAVAAMLQTASDLARHLDGVLQDERGNLLDEQGMQTLQLQAAEWRRHAAAALDAR
jgi:cell division protein ZipA